MIIVVDDEGLKRDTNLGYVWSLTLNPSYKYTVELQSIKSVYTYLNVYYDLNKLLSTYRVVKR